MEINEQELHRRLNSSKNLKNALSERERLEREGTVCEVRKNIEKPDTEQAIVIPEVTILPIEKKTSHSFPPNANLRILAGSLALQGVPAREISEELDITLGQVISAKRTKNPEIAGPRDASIDRVHELALSKTMEAIGLMTSDKFINLGIKELAQVASQMATVVERTAPKEVIVEDNRVQYMIYAPQEKSERAYKTIDV